MSERDGGPEQIRTAVKGFADLCLATRPRNLDRGAKIKQSYQASKQILTPQIIFIIFE